MSQLTWSNHTIQNCTQATFSDCLSFYNVWTTFSLFYISNPPFIAPLLLGAIRRCNAIGLPTKSNAKTIDRPGIDDKWPVSEDKLLVTYIKLTNYMASHYLLRFDSFIFFQRVIASFNSALSVYIIHCRGGGYTPGTEIHSGEGLVVAILVIPR